MWRRKSCCSTIYRDVCLRVPKRSATTQSVQSIKNRNSTNPTKEDWKKIFEQYATLKKLTPTDWYQLSSTSLDEDLQQLVSKKFGGSLYRALSSLFPEIEWKAWKFEHQQVPKNFWKEQSNQRKFFDDLGHTLGVKTLDDWYEKLSKNEIEKNGGSTVLDHHKNSAANALMLAYPEHSWMPWKFTRVSAGFWNDKSNQRRYFDYLGKLLGVETMDDWYSKLSWHVIERNGGLGLLKHYNQSPSVAVMAVYPEHNWIPYKFINVSKSVWNSKATVGQFVNELSDKLSIQTLDDWYRVDGLQLRRLGAGGLLFRYKGLYNILKEQYPHHPWNPNKFHQHGKAQRWLTITLKKIFPNEEIVEGYIHPKAVFPSSNRPMELDIYIPSRSLAFEYQGEQHYMDVGVFSPSRNYQIRDKEKRALCAANNIKLIEVPYWWNKTQEELQKIIDKNIVAHLFDESNTKAV